MSAQDVLVLVETQQDVLAEISCEMLAGARQLAGSTGGRVIALVLTATGSTMPAGLSTADRILVIEDPLLASYAPEPYLAVLESVVTAESPRVIFVGSTSIGWDLAAALAARLDAPIVNGCQAVSAQGDTLKVRASYFAGKMLADVEIADTPAVLMILPASFRPINEAGQGQIETRKSPVLLSAGAITFEEMIQPEAGDVDLTQEEVLVAVGRGIEQEDNMEVAEELAAALGGQICASRPIIDQGWLAATRQIGKSGMTVKPKCYFALGISGAPEHVEGMKDSDLVIAINTDPNAPIFDVAHYGVVGDLLDIVPALTEAIRGD